MFPYSHFKKEYKENTEITTISFGLAYFSIEFNNSFDVSVKCNVSIWRRGEFIIDIDYSEFLSKKSGEILELKKHSLLKIQEFDKSEEYPEGCMIFYFETGYELRVIFSPYYESCVITFNEGEDKGVWVF